MAPNKRDQKRKRIIIVGAGIAGLVAARECQQQQQELEILILEARNRPGGRLWTVYHHPNKDEDDEDSALPLDLGATWIHGVRNNPMTLLVNEMSTLDNDRCAVELGTTYYDRSITYDTDGTPLSTSESHPLNALKKTLSKALKRAQKHHKKDSSLRQIADSVASRQGNNSEDTRRWLNFILSGDYEQEYAGSAEKLSAFWYDNVKEYAGEDALFLRGGYSKLIEHLVSTITQTNTTTIEMDQIVQEIHWKQDQDAATDSSPPVRIVTTTDEFYSDQVIVTVPLGVLQQRGIQFVPDLPANKRSAVDAIGVGVLNKCFLCFAEAFWPEHVDWIEYVPLQHGEWTEWVSLKRVANANILVGFTAAVRAKEMEAWSDESIVASAMQTLRTIYGSEVPEPMDYYITRWGRDPFAMGSYSFNAVGSNPNARKVLASPLDDTLFFTGEATEKEYYGTAHGAYRSGVRVAREVLKTH